MSGWSWVAYTRGDWLGIGNIALYLVSFIAFGNARAVMISSANRTGIVSVLGGSAMMGRLYIVLSLAGCAISIIRYGDQEWIPYMKKTPPCNYQHSRWRRGGGLLCYLC